MAFLHQSITVGFRQQNTREILQSEHPTFLPQGNYTMQPLEMFQTVTITLSPGVEFRFSILNHP